MARDLMFLGFPAGFAPGSATGFASGAADGTTALGARGFAGPRSVQGLQRAACLTRGSAGFSDAGLAPRGGQGAADGRAGSRDRPRGSRSDGIERWGGNGAEAAGGEGRQASAA